jgi:hypothetical protein
MTAQGVIDRIFDNWAEAAASRSGDVSAAERRLAECRAKRAEFDKSCEGMNPVILRLHEFLNSGELRKIRIAEMEARKTIDEHHFRTLLPARTATRDLVAELTRPFIQGGGVVHAQLRATLDNARDQARNRLGGLAGDGGRAALEDVRVRRFAQEAATAERAVLEAGLAELKTMAAGTGVKADAARRFFDRLAELSLTEDRLIDVRREEALLGIMGKAGVGPAGPPKGGSARVRPERGPRR